MPRFNSIVVPAAAAAPTARSERGAFGLLYNTGVSGCSEIMISAMV